MANERLSDRFDQFTERARNFISFAQEEAVGQRLPDRFDQFTERARIAVAFAGEEAVRLQSPLIEPPHLALGLVKERDEFGLARKVLVNLGVNLDELQMALEPVIVKDPTSTVELPTINPTDMKFSPRGKRAIELAFSEASRLDHHYIGTEHLLLGILAEGQGDDKSETVTVLENNFGVNLEKAREETRRIVSLPYRTVQSTTPENISDDIWALRAWHLFLKDPSMTEETRMKYVDILLDLLEKEAKEYKNQQNNQQSSN